MNSSQEKTITRNHDLKIEDCYLDNLLLGRKTAEIRFNDRDYQVGDTITFRFKENMLESVSYRITHIHSGLGMKEGYVVLSLKLI
jgi:ASC-1-like (ASCH) protein